MMQRDEVIGGIWDHVRYLSVILGGRGSCTPVEERAARYAADRMREAGVAGVELEPFQGSPSTYQPYALALGLGALGTLLMWIGDLLGPDIEFWMLILAAILNGLGAWGMIAESDLATSWMRRLLPRAQSYNAVGIIPAAVQARQRVVLSAHLDSHRTPFFFASQRNLLIFRALVLFAWFGMALETILYLLAALFAWDWVFWFGAVALLQVMVLDMCLRADSTPFSPGANDNASGVAVALGLAQRLVEEPLSQTDESAFVQKAIELGLLTQEQADQAVRLQFEAETQGRRPGIVDVLVRTGRLSAEQEQQVRRAMGGSGSGSKSQQLEGYVLRSRIGRGGMGTVYKARQVSMDRLVLSGVPRSHGACLTIFKHYSSRRAID